MSTLPAVLRPSGLSWTVLRLHRGALITWGSFVAAVVAVLVWTNEVTADAALREQASCARRSTCSVPETMAYSERIGWIGTFICFSFLVVAAFAGGALTGRELENGTAELAWTQSVTPTRWLAAKLAWPALLLVTSGTVLVVTYRWAWSAHRNLMSDDWSTVTVFAARGPLVVAYALCALALGALTGIVLRRALPALAASLFLLFVLYSVLLIFRWDLWPSASRVAAVSDPSAVPEGAHELGWGAITASGAHREGVHCGSNVTSEGLERCLAGRGLSATYVEYQPESHYWPLHLVETGVVLAVAVLATGCAFWLLRRRTA
ncbi:ABC transporter permease [Streptomyces sp. NPDC059785]|uniref:ABC transporter permease n=1 Tax=unclassified Streptomyces TaxID=2593676 RepID=UPI00366092C2